MDHQDPWSSAAIEQNRHWLYAYLLSSTGDSHAADDLVQEVFQIAYEKRASFTPGTNFGGWLRMISRNCLKRHFDRSKKRPIFTDDLEGLLDEASMEMEEQSLDPDWLESRVAAMKTCLEQLGQKARDILLLRYSEDKSSKEISELLGMTVTSIDVTTFRARNALGKCIEKKIAHAG